tara:strand:+ start:57 stop:218 length:162 start_codon:yes stop_codon:yes gene_type:complete
MTSLINDFIKIARDYSDLLEDTDWRVRELSSYVPVNFKLDFTYSELLEDTEWA